MFRRRLPIISISANVREEQVAEVCLATYLICASLMSSIDARLRHRCVLWEALQDWRSTGEYTTAHPLIWAGLARILRLQRHVKLVYLSAGYLLCYI